MTTTDIEAALDYLARSQVLGETVVVQAGKLRTVLAHVRDLEAKVARYAATLDAISDGNDHHATWARAALAEDQGGDDV